MVFIFLSLFDLLKCPVMQMNLQIFSPYFDIVCKYNVESKTLLQQPGRAALSVGHLTRTSEVLGTISGLATFFRFSFH